MVSLETIGEQFAEMGIEPAPAILGRCLDLCTTYNIGDPVEFVEQWMAFSVSHLGGAEPTLDNLTDLERKELAALSKTAVRDRAAAAAAATSTVAVGRSVASQVLAYESAASPSAKVFGSGAQRQGAGRAALLDDGEDDFMDSYITRTPKANQRAQSRLQHLAAGADSPASQTTNTSTCASPLTGKTVQSYVSGQAIYTFGNATLVKNTTWSSVSRRRVAIRHVAQKQPGDALNGEPPASLSAADKYMFDTLLEKSLSAADRLYGIGHQICEKLQHDWDASRAAASDQTPPANGADAEDNAAELLSVCDSLVHPDAASPHLVTCVGRICSDAGEGSKLTASGAMLLSTDDQRVRTVRLHLGRLRSFGLFAGQTVAVRGRNPRGDTLYVDELHAERQLRREPVPQLAGADPLCVLVVSGPYTLDDDLTYEPLHDLLAYCGENRPDVLVMLGPFVEAEHTMVVDGVLQDAFEVFFEKIVAEVMEKIGPDTQVVMVASSADVNSTAVYPTHPLAVRRSYANLTMVGDPSVLNVGGVTFAVTATDVLQHLHEAELAHNAGERIKRAVNYMFHQGSFYPLDPPQLDVGVDSELAGKYAVLRTVPNVLLVPGEQKCFIRDIAGCLVLNPGRLAERRTRGTFARLVISAPASRDEATLSNYVACQVMKV